MKKSIIYMLILSLGMAFTACNKDQQTVNRLEGTWSYDRVTQNGMDVTAHYHGFTITFEKCKLKKDDWCPGVMTGGIDPKTGSPNNISFEYKISDKGETITKRISIPFMPLETTVGDIKDHTKDRFEYSYTEVETYEDWDDEKEEMVWITETYFMEITLKKR